MFLSKYVSGFFRVRVVQKTDTFASVGRVCDVSIFHMDKVERIRQKPQNRPPPPHNAPQSHIAAGRTRPQAYKTLVGIW